MQDLITPADRHYDPTCVLFAFSRVNRRGGATRRRKMGAYKKIRLTVDERSAGPVRADLPAAAVGGPVGQRDGRIAGSAEASARRSPVDQPAARQGPWRGARIETGAQRCGLDAAVMVGASGACDAHRWVGPNVGARRPARAGAAPKRWQVGARRTCACYWLAAAPGMRLRSILSRNAVACSPSRAR